MDQRDRQQLINLSLEKKIEYSKNIITGAIRRFSREKLFIAWTGGKDSTTMLWLYLTVCKELKIPMPTAMFIDEGDIFDEILELVDKVTHDWDVEVAMVKNADVVNRAEDIGDLIRVADLNDRNRMELKKLEYNEEYFAFEPESFVGNHLMKTVAMQVFLEENSANALSTGIRWDEQDSRLDEEFFSPRTEPVHTRVHPIMHFEERDIWDTIHAYNIPFCSLYSLGYRSLGAKTTTLRNSDTPAWEQDLKNTPERIGRGQEKEKIMERLRSLGYM